jgi:hypothetical protein
MDRDLTVAESFDVSGFRAARQDVDPARRYRLGGLLCGLINPLLAIFSASSAPAWSTGN